MKSKWLLGSALFLFTLPACENKSEIPNQDNTEQFVNLIGKVQDSHPSRVDGQNWSVNDTIGVFMLRQSDRTVLSANAPYVTPHGNGSFNSVNLPLTYPKDNAAVNLIAYYPYKAQQSALQSLSIDVNNQSDPQKLDILYSRNLTNVSRTSDPQRLIFRHLLSKVLLNIQSTSPLEGLKIRIDGLKTAADFNLSDSVFTLKGNEQSIQMRIGEESRYAEAVLIPQTLNTPLRLQLEWNGKTRTVATPIKDKLEAGNKYIINVDVKTGANVVEVIPEATYTKWYETPFISKATLDNPNFKYISHYLSGGIRNFSLLYNNTDKFAYWVAYPLCSYYRGESGRNEDWDFDPLLPKDWQPDLHKSYPGYDRGHQIPSADRTGSTQMNIATFYFSNMTPQIGAAFNRDIWQRLEEKVRTWMTGTDTLYVVTGALPFSETDKTRKTIHVNGMTVTVPKVYFKALARKLVNTYYTIGFYLPHKEYAKGESYMKYAISVEELEKKTGFTFFPSLNHSSKANLNLSKWQ